MIVFAMLMLLVYFIVVFALLVRSKSSFERVLCLSLLSALVTAEIVLLSMHTGLAMLLDVALAFALLGFLDIQFYCVYLREKGGL